MMRNYLLIANETIVDRFLWQFLIRDEMSRRGGKRFTRKKRSSKGKLFQKGHRVGGPVRGRKKSPAERRVASVFVGAEYSGVH